MKRMRSTLATFAMFVCICSNAAAAELLDVKPVVAGDAVSVEISADIPMTYTYYNVPGQPRAVVDIADADPEKVEPLIVVNQGVVSSISVDKVQIAGMVVSRIIFNLVSESGIAVAATQDRKILTVTFATASKSAATTKPVEASQATPAGVNAEDPLGLDEPAPVRTTESIPAPVEIPSAATIPALPATVIKTKIESVVPAVSHSATLYIKEIIAGDSYIDIQTTAAVGNYKVIKMTQPARIAIDIPGAKSSLGTSSVSINKFGVTKARIGINPGHIRIVLDSAKADFPKHTITHGKDGLRINFN